MKTMTGIRIGLWIAVALVTGAVAAVFFGGGSSSAPSAGESPYGSPFQLVDQNGETITEADLRGEPAAVFFGFTHCPEVCPTTLFELAGHQKAIRSEGGDFQVVFVTVDPERDTPAILKDYVEAVGGDVTAITGEPDEVAALAKGWGVYFRKVEEGAGYTMDHTATTFLVDGEGVLQGTIAYGENSDTARAKLERLTGV